MTALSLLQDALITASPTSGPGRSVHSLPGILAALARGEIGDFPRLRPHQRHVWHALLVQLAGLALSAAGRAELPETEGDWLALLLALTPDHPDGSAWALVGPPDRPAFLQAPVPEGNLSGFRAVATPDELDILILAKNHDLKSNAMPADDPELWLYALASLQTQEGYSGRDNFGISRMNSGYGSRPALGVTPSGGASAQFRRDCRRALALRAELSIAHGYRSQGGLGLVWLKPWDGTQPIAMTDFDLFYVEICRRVRLVQTETGLCAFVTSTKAARIEAKHLSGVTGDLWTPRVHEKDGSKGFTLDARGWTYQQMVRLLFPAASKKGDSIAPAPLQALADDDDREGLVFLARAVVRGQGKTEGFHERRVPVSRHVLRGLGRYGASDRLAALAHDRVKDAGVFVRQVLFPAILAIYAGAPRKEAGERSRDDDTTKARASAAANRLDPLIDPHFFADLDAEIAVMDDPAAAEHVRAQWIAERLWPAGETVFAEALSSAPDAAVRHWRVRASARDILVSSFRKQFGERLKAAGITRWSAAAPADDTEDEAHA